MSEENYIETIPESFREVESIKNAGSLEALLEQHVNLEKKMGNSLFFPGDDADDDQRKDFRAKVMERADGLTVIPDMENAEDRNSFYNKIGRPEEAAGYEVPDITDHNGDKLSQEAYIEDFRTVAHEAGLSSYQFKQMIGWFDKNAKTASEANATAQAELTDALQKEWGDGTDARVARVQKLVELFGGEGAPADLHNIKGHPAVVQMLDKIAESMGEEMSLDKNTSHINQETRTDIEDKIAELRNNKAYLDSKHVDHKRVVERVNTLTEKLGAFKQAAA